MFIYEEHDKMQNMMLSSQKNENYTLRVNLLGEDLLILYLHLIKNKNV